jgi:hypothetical protein
LERARTLQPKTDYDILYITGNAAASTAYDRFGKGDPAVELVDLEETRQIMKVNYQGSWRVDPAGPAKARLPATGSISRRPRLRILADGYYRTIGRHPHEEMLAAQDAVRVRQSCLPDIEAWIAKRSVGHVFEAPCGTFVSVPDGMAYGGGDPNRTVVARNRQLARGTGARFRHLQMLYSRFPTADLFICPDFLEWLPFAEAFRVLQRIAVSKPRMVAFTGYRLLRQSWDTALGDFRPIHLELPPFSFPPPAETLPLPTKPVGGRPDRSLMLWELAALRPRLS